MSNNTIISIKKYEVEDFFSVDHGTEHISLTVFWGKASDPGWVHTTELSPEQAEALGKELISRAEKARKNQ